MLLLNEKRLKRLERFFFWVVVLRRDVVVEEPEMFDVRCVFWVEDLLLLALDVMEPDMVACGCVEQFRIWLLDFLRKFLFCELLESKD